MAGKQIESTVSTLISDDLLAMGYELVRVQMMGGGRFSTLQIMAERLDNKGMTVDDCAAISHAVSEKLDADKNLSDRYTLEVSSPGIDRPLVRLKDYERFTGHVARLELDAPLDGRKRFQGSIVRVSGQADAAEIEIRTETGDVRVPMQSIARAKLVLTDALLSAAEAEQHEGMKH